MTEPEGIDRSQSGAELSAYVGKSPVERERDRIEQRLERLETLTTRLDSAFAGFEMAAAGIVPPANVATLTAAPGVIADRSDQIDQIVGALARAQAKFHAVKRNAANPFFNSRYADLAAVMDVARGPLADEGLALFQTFEQDPAQPDWITTVSTLAHGPSGQWITNRIAMRALPKRRKRKDGDEEERIDVPGGALSAQDIASGAQYGRRYGAQALLNIVAEGEDDDGNRASGNRGKGGKSDEWQEYLAANPKIAAALQVDHPIIVDIVAKAPRYGHLTEKQAALVLKLARERHEDEQAAGLEGAGASYTDEPYGGPAAGGQPWPPSAEETRAMFELVRKAGGEVYRPGTDGKGLKHVRLPAELVEQLGAGYGDGEDFAVASLDRQRWNYLGEVLREYTRVAESAPGGKGAAGGMDSAGPDTGSTATQAKGGSQDSSPASARSGSTGAKAAPPPSSARARAEQPGLIEPVNEDVPF